MLLFLDFCWGRPTSLHLRYRRGVKRMMFERSKDFLLRFNCENSFVTFSLLICQCTSVFPKDRSAKILKLDRGNFFLDPKQIKIWFKVSFTGQILSKVVRRTILWSAEKIWILWSATWKKFGKHWCTYTKAMRNCKIFESGGLKISETSDTELAIKQLVKPANWSVFTIFPGFSYF